MQLFYDNGGDERYIVPVGLSGDNDGTVSLAGLQKGLREIGERVGSTMLVVPDAVKPEKASDFALLLKDMLDQCGKLQDRMVILDVYGADKLDQTSATFTADRNHVIAGFRQSVGQVAPGTLNYGAAYHPFLKADLSGMTSLLPPGAAMAGVYAQIDNARGIRNAPANSFFSLRFSSSGDLSFLASDTSMHPA